MHSRPLSADESRAWQAVRVRLAQQQPALGSALYRATPVAVNELGAGSSADAWGRIYVDFALEQRKGIDALSDAAERALASWLQDGGTIEPYHVDLDDDRFPAVAAGERDTLALLTAGRFESMPPHRSGDDTAGDLWSVWANQLVGAGTVPWQRVLAGHLRSALSYGAGAVDYTYSRPSRRHIRGVVLPAMRHPRVAIAIVCDVSPSVANALDLIGAEVSRVARAAGVDPAALTVIPTDDTVREVTRYRANLKLPAPGGSTDMRVGIAAAEGARPKPDAIVVITDGITPWPERPTAVPLIVALVRPSETQLEFAARDVPAWASLVRVAVLP